MEKLTKTQLECYRYIKENHPKFRMALGDIKTFCKFINNIDLNFNKSSKRNNEINYLKNIDYRYILIRAFNWQASPEGDEFWRTINRQYRCSIGESPDNW